MKTLLLSFSMLFIFSLTLFAQNKKELKQQQKEAQYKQVIGLVNSGNYEFVGRFAYPQKGNQIDLTTRPNFLRITDTVAKAEMPYFGRAYSGGYSTVGGGITFDSQVMDYKIEENDQKLRLTISFRVKADSETYNCILQAGNLEGATLLVTSSNRQSIRYNGALKVLEEEQ